MLDSDKTVMRDVSIWTIMSVICNWKLLFKCRENKRIKRIVKFQARFTSIIGKKRFLNENNFMKYWYKNEADVFADKRM